MSRPSRLLLSHTFYHIMTRGNNRMTIFKDNEDYLYYLKLLEKYKKEHPFDLYHYCLMPSHVHMLTKTKDAKNFAIFMKRINLAYYHYFRQKYGWVGHLWQGRYKSQAVGKDNYFIQAGKYIELNPLRKGLVEKPEDYLYSSCRYYVSGEPNDLISQDFIYETMGKDQQERQDEYQKLVISDEIIQSYNKNTWGTINQRKNEYIKDRYYRSNN